MWITIKEYFNILTKPFIAILSTIVAMIKSIANILDVIRGQIKVMRNLIFGITIGIMKRIENTTNATIFAYSKIYDVLKRQSAIYENMVNTMQTTAVLLSGFTQGSLSKILDISDWAIWALPIFTLGPAGAIFPAAAMCFSKDTIIGGKYISEYKVGEYIDNTTQVLSTHIYRNVTPLYDYNGVLVSGSHLVLEHGKFLPVFETKYRKETKIVPTYVYNLSTSNFRIKIGNTYFMDYDEAYTSEIENTHLLNYLNNTRFPVPKYINKRYRFGFVKEIPITNKLLGYSKHLSIADDKFYIINNTICTEYTVLFYNNKWVNARDIGIPINNTFHSFTQYYTEKPSFTHDNIRWCGLVYST
jgi:hypothetical protein